ncbi:DUF6559 family protein [Aeromonas dhakensis]|uniref:DUF6559 family protein n=1 Tax=Aeromonas dhakensis TaxID=196024 RepID=UPI002D7833F0|nr:DUF6559 family protein [Aeromonas dhakensis]WRT73580.1 DUF6559 family protein [Aeromonas dhakensis]
MGWFTRFRERRALRRYLTMSAILAKEYGAREQYSAGQLLTQARIHKLPPRWLHYYFALYRHESAPELASGWQLDDQRLLALRQSLAESLFHHDIAYTALDVRELARPAQWRGGSDRKVQTQGITFRQY